MEKKKISEEPEFITKEENGMFFLEVKMSEKLRKEMQELAEYTSGAILVK